MAWTIPVSAKIFLATFLSNGRELIGFQAESALRGLRKIITAGISVLPNQMQDVIVIWCEMGPSYFVGSFFRRWRNSIIEAVSIEPRSTCIAQSRL